VTVVNLLERPVMTAREAARQLDIPPTTLMHWLEGEARADTWYPPVLREEPTGSNEIVWGEMVEARYLRAYRQRVSMQQLRQFITGLRREFGLNYPLAHSKPFVGPGRRLLLELQEDAGLPASMRMVYEVTTGQLILDSRVDEFLARVTFDDEGERQVQRMHPAGRNSPVVMDPRVGSAASTVRGIRTEVLSELADSDVSVEEIAADFHLPVAVVKAALSYEWSRSA
jgi:uncharacterized protein (DUF433 family)